MREFYIGNKKIGENQPVYFIAESGVNHEGNRFLARALIDIAAWAGADALKIQTFKADLVATKNAPKADYQQANLGTEDSQYEMLKKLELSESLHEMVQKECIENKLEFLSTPHSGEWSVDYLDSLGVNAFKIASPDLTNIPFLKYIAKKGKPIILSTGMGTLEEVVEAVETVRSQGNNNIAVLHCTTNYPCLINEVNLRAMQTIKEECKVLIGYSDHTQFIEVPIMATALGARVIEKHITLDQKLKGNSPDHRSSLTPSQLKETIEAIRFVEEREIKDPIEAVLEYQKKVKEVPTFGMKDLLLGILGDGIKKPQESELKIMENIRKGIVAGRYIGEGEIISEKNITIKRPMGGFKPKYYERLIESKAMAIKNIIPDEPINIQNCNFIPE